MYGVRGICVGNLYLSVNIVINLKLLLKNYIFKTVLYLFNLGKPQSFSPLPSFNKLN